ncbi:MAG: hypothetical protein ACI4SV_01365 [Duodenibacillus sp.]
MTRRQQKMSPAKAKTAWLAWCAWGFLGGIFVFEDTLGGSGTFVWIFTAPFWALFAAWPFLWLWLRTRKGASLVEMDDDIRAGDVSLRLVQKDGVRYVGREQLAKVLAAQANKLPNRSETLAGGDEAFVRLEDVRGLAQHSQPFSEWLDIVDAIADPFAGTR